AAWFNPQAERVPGGIEVYPYVLLRLKISERRAGGDRVRAGLLEVIDLDIQMHHHLLVARAGRPHRADVAAFGLERKTDSAIMSTERLPSGFVGPGLPAEQPAVEVRELPCVWRIEHHAGDRHRGRHPYLPPGKWDPAAQARRLRTRNELIRPIRPPPTASQAPRRKSE